MTYRYFIHLCFLFFICFTANAQEKSFQQDQNAESFTQILTDLSSFSDSELKAMGYDITAKQVKALLSHHNNLNQTGKLSSEQIKALDSQKKVEDHSQPQNQTEAGALCLDNKCGLGLSSQAQNICESLINSPLCEGIDEKLKKQCPDQDNAIVDFGQAVWGCLRYSVWEMLTAVWEIMKWIGRYAVGDDETHQQAEKALSSVKLYLNTEYQKAHDKASPPRKSVKAAMAVSGVLAKLLYQSIEDMISQDIEQWPCLNTQGKSAKVCDYLMMLGGTGISAWQMIKLSKKLMLSRRLKKASNAKKAQLIREAPKLVRKKQLKKILAQHANNPNIEVRMAVAHSARFLKEPDGRHILSRFMSMKHATPKERFFNQRLAQTVAESAGKLKSAPILKNLYSKTTPKGQAAVMQNIGRLNKDQSAQTMLKLIRKDSPPEVDLAIIQNANRLGDQQGGKVLSTLYGMKQNSLTGTAKLEMAKTASKLKGRQAGLLLRQMADDPDNLVKKAVAQNAVHLENKKSAVGTLFYLSGKKSLPFDIKESIAKSISLIKYDTPELKTTAQSALFRLADGTADLMPSTSRAIVQSAYSLGDEGKKFINKLFRAKWKDLSQANIKSVIQLAGSLNSSNRTHLLSHLALDPRLGIRRDVLRNAERFLTPIERKTPSLKKLDQDPMLKQAISAENALKRTLNADEIRAVYKSHMAGFGQKGKDGSLAGVGNYTKQQIAKKTRILKEAGFSKAERRKLMKEGIAGFPLKKSPPALKEVSFKIPKASVEVGLKSKGHRTIYTQGLDHSLEMIHLGQQLRKTKNIDPYKTHIANFEKPALEHIQFMEKALDAQKKQAREKIYSNPKYYFKQSIHPKSLTPNDLSQPQNSLHRIHDRSRLLKELKKETQGKIKNKQLTYDYYVKMNYYLSILATDDIDIPFLNSSLETVKDRLISDNHLASKHRVGTSYRHLEQEVNLFPQAILLPTVKNMGVIGFNQSFHQNIHFLGVIGKTTRVDGRSYNPHDFFRHDYGHYKNTFYNSFGGSMGRSKWKKISPKILNQFEKLPPKKREMAELIYFLIAHESYPYQLIVDLRNQLTAIEVKFSDFHGHRATKSDDLELLIPKNIRQNTEAIENYFEKSVDVFNEILNQVDFDSMNIRIDPLE